MQLISLHINKTHIKMNKSELIKHLSIDSEVPKADVEKVINCLPYFIKTVVMDRDDKIAIPGLCSFSRKTKAEHNARNPKSGESVYVPQKEVLVIKVSKSF